MNTAKEIFKLKVQESEGAENVKINALYQSSPYNKHIILQVRHHCIQLVTIICRNINKIGLYISFITLTAETLIFLHSLIPKTMKG